MSLDATRKTHAGGLGQNFDDKAEPVVAQAEALVVQQPGISALDRPAAPAQTGAVQLATLADARLGATPAAQVAVTLDIMGFVGKCRSNAEHDHRSTMQYHPAWLHVNALTCQHVGTIKW